MADQAKGRATAANRAPARSNALQIMEILKREGRAVGPYELLHDFRQRGPCSPPTLYRALQRLEASGDIHRVPSTGAYLPCASQGCAGLHVLMTCEQCGKVSERPSESVRAAVQGVCGASGFLVQSRTIEVAGICPNCLAGLRA